METTRSEQLFKKAVDLIPGGVNSPVRAFGNVGMTPGLLHLQVEYILRMQMATNIWIM